MHAFDPGAIPIDGANWAGHWIDGQIVTEGLQSFPVRRPSDGKVHAELPLADADMVDRAVRSAERAAASWRRVGPRDRARVLRRWADAIAADGVTVARLEAIVSARPIEEVMQVDLPNAIEWIRFYAEYCDKVDGAVLPTDESLLSLTTYDRTASSAPSRRGIFRSCWRCGKWRPRSRRATRWC